MSPSQRYRLHSHLPEVPRLDQRHWEEAWRKYEAAVVPTTKKTEADEDGAADAKAKENELYAWPCPTRTEVDEFIANIASDLRVRHLIGSSNYLPEYRANRFSIGSQRTS